MAAHHDGADWRKRLRHSSFRGASFWTERDGINGGRRVVTHEFPLAELPYNEDMGQQSRRYEVEAYCVGEQADKEAVALVTACTTRGPATLVLPLFGTIRARCLEIHSDRNKDKHGYVAFRLLFVAEGNELSALGGTPHLLSQAQQMVNDLPPILAGPLGSRFATIGDEPVPGSSSVLAAIPDFVLVSAVALLSDFLTDFEVVLSTSELRGDDSAALNQKLDALNASLDDLASVGTYGSRFAVASFVSGTSDVPDVSPLVDGIYGLLSDYREAVAPEIAIPALASLSEFGSEGLVAIPKTTLARKRESENRESLLDLFQRSALAQLALAIMQASYPSRHEAIAARADIAVRFGAALDPIVDPEEWEVVQAMRALEGAAIEYLTKLMTDLAPVIVLEAPVRLPSLYWGWRLYGDATRGDQLWERNSVKHPAWLPTEFEALAR